MLKSNNFNSIVDDLSAFSAPTDLDVLRPTTLQLDASNIKPLADLDVAPQFEYSGVASVKNNNTYFYTNNEITEDETDTATTSKANVSLATLQLTAGVLQAYAPPVANAKTQLKELIQKQNKIYIDLSAEKFKLDNADVAKLQEMMNNVKACREKLLKIKKNMQNIYQRTKVLKKRAINIQMCKEKELQRKLQKQQQEESLIGKNTQ